MTLQTLPQRPLTLEEVYRSYHQSDDYIEVTFVNAVVDEESNQSFALDLIFVSNEEILAVRYDVENKEWTEVFRAPNESESRSPDDNVDRERVSKARKILEKSVGKFRSEGLAGEVIDESAFGEGKAVSREAPELTTRIRRQYQDET